MLGICTYIKLIPQHISALMCELRFKPAALARHEYPTHESDANILRGS